MIFFAYYFGGEELRPPEIQAWIWPPLQGQKVKASGPLSARANSGRNTVAVCQELGHWAKEFVNGMWNEIAFLLPVFLILEQQSSNFTPSVRTCLFTTREAGIKRKLLRNAMRSRIPCQFNKLNMAWNDADGLTGFSGTFSLSAHPTSSSNEKHKVCIPNCTQLVPDE